MVGQHIGQYRILDRIGHGGMGTVYHAIDEMLEREVALKALGGEPGDLQQRFRAEAIALARLNHPGIATVYELFQHEGRWVMVMELVRGQTLQQMVEQIGVFSPQRAAELCMQALAALAHAHSVGVVHRDLKPSNLMITETGTVKILDFGIARLDGSVHLTSAGCMMGTPAYMAPEQVQGHEIDARVDLYAMGVVFYRLISAELPFQGETPFAMAQSQVNDAPTPIDLVRPDLPPWVHRIVVRALAKAPDQRFQSAVEFHDGFARCLAGLPLHSAHSANAVTELAVRPTSLISTASLASSIEMPPMPRSLRAGDADRNNANRNNAVAPRRRRVAAWIGIASAAIAVVAGIGTTLRLRAPSSVPPPIDVSLPTRAVDTPSAAMTGRGAVAAESTVPRTVQVESTVPRTAQKAASATSRTEAAVNRPAAPMMFSSVKLLVVDGGRTNDRNVLLTFSNGQIMAMPTGGGAPIAAVPYRQIAKATYVHSRDPQWDPLLSAPPNKINPPGFIGRSRHWLVVQTKETYAILRLDGDDWPEVLKTFEAGTGVTIDRRLPIDRDVK